MLFGAVGYQFSLYTYGVCQPNGVELTLTATSSRSKNNNIKEPSPVGHVDQIWIASLSVRCPVLLLLHPDQNCGCGCRKSGMQHVFPFQHTIKGTTNPVVFRQGEGGRHFISCTVRDHEAHEALFT